MIHNHRKGIVMSSLWRQSRSLRNKSKLFSATITKSKKPKSPVGNFFDFIKQWWLLISGGSFALTIALLIGGYSSVFSGDIGASIEYVQAYIPSMGITKIAVILVVVMLSFTVLFFIPVHASTWLFEKKWHGQPVRKRILWVVTVFAICIIGALFAVFIITFLSGGYLTNPRIAFKYFIYYSVMVCISVFYFIIGLPGLMWLLKMFGIREERSRRSWITRFLVGVMIIVSLWQPENILSVINSGNDEGYVACVSGDRVINGKPELFAKSVFPVSYDTKGVQVFSGNYDKKTKKWSNIRREYLYFDQGYNVKFGAKCPG
jgi:putative NADH-ubiquinone oxidoreductase chain 2